MRLGHYYRKIRTLPPGELINRARNKAEDRFNRVVSRWQGYRKPTYRLRYPSWLSTGLARHFPATLIPTLRLGVDLSGRRLWIDHFLAHRFNLLGSGWVEVKRQATGPAQTAHTINAANLTESTRIAGLVRKGYVPIDWQADFKSGHYWPVDAWHTDPVFGSPKGADIKVPWELARMQHLVQFAWAYAASSPEEKGPGSASGGAEGFQREFQDQILDFIAANPPGFGVNWVCAMDVGIRIANWVIARDLFRAAGAVFDPEFEALFARSVYEHGEHIIGNLEWSRGLRSNHYYANIAGLAVVAAALPSGPESDAWLAFTVRELIAETEIQFQPDGSNFEASTCYHRLSAEMAAYATAMVLNVPEARLSSILSAPPKYARYLPRFFQNRTLTPHRYPGWSDLPFPPWYFERLERAAEFTMAITRPDGHAPQFGDNDSGRFLKLFPALRSGDNYGEDFLDHRHLVAALNGFFGRRDFASFAGDADRESHIIAALLGGRVFPSYSQQEVTGEQPIRYPDFGLYLYRKRDYHLAFRCGSIGQLGNGGHAHNDQLSFELAVKGVSFLEDPGTFLYTPDWAGRNLFRSTAYHNTLAVEGLEQNPWENTRSGLFSLISRSRAETIEVDEWHISGCHQGFEVPHKRALELGEATIIGMDWCEHAGSKSLAFHFASEVKVRLTENGDSVEALRDGIRLTIRTDTGIWFLETATVSPAYGESRSAQVSRLQLGGETRVKWYIEWSR